MKISIAVTLIITIAVFSFVSGYSIGAHNKQNSQHEMITSNSTKVLSTVTTTAAESTSTASGGYGSPSLEKTDGNYGSSPGYGAPSPGYGQ